MATLLYDVLTLEGSPTGVYTAMRNRQIGFETSGDKRMLRKDNSGNLNHWTPDEEFSVGATGVAYSIPMSPTIADVGAALDQLYTSVTGINNPYSIGLTGMTSMQVLFGNASQSSSLTYTGTQGLRTNRIGVGVVNDASALANIGMDGGNPGIQFIDLGLGSPIFDNHNHNSAPAASMGQIIGGGLTTDGGTIVRGWGLTGVSPISIQGIISSAKGTVNKSAIELIARGTDGADGTTGISAASKLLAIKNNSTNMLTLDGDGNMVLTGNLTCAGQNVTGMNLHTSLCGVTALSNDQVWWTRFGNTVDMWVDIAGSTGVGDDVYLALPYQHTDNFGTAYFPCRVSQEGVASVSIAAVAQGGSNLYFYPDMAANPWTAYKSRSIHGHITYYVKT